MVTILFYYAVFLCFQSHFLACNYLELNFNQKYFHK